MLCAQGVSVILVPRATPPGSYDRWKLVLRSIAVTGATYVVSINRPAPELGVEIGGPSVVIAPDGDVIAESTDRLTVVELDAAQVERARADYPGYLAIRSDLYARAWRDIPPRP